MRAQAPRNPGIVRQAGARAHKRDSGGRSPRACRPGSRNKAYRPATPPDIADNGLARDRANAADTAAGQTADTREKLPARASCPPGAAQALPPAPHDGPKARRRRRTLAIRVEKA